MSEQVPTVVVPTTNDAKYIIISNRAGYSWVVWQGSDEATMGHEFWKEIQAGNEPRLYERRPMSLVQCRISVIMRRMKRGFESGF